MSKPTVYPLRWRGRETGPYPLSVIEQKLDAHESGLWHEIQSDGRWVTLEEFLAALSQQREAQETHRREEQAQAQADEDRRARENQAALQELEKQNRLLRQQIEQIERRDAGGPTPSKPAAASASPVKVSPEIRPQPLPPGGDAMDRPAGRSRKRMVFALLGLFLGFLGAHNFYAGYLAKGVAQLALTLGASWLGFGWILTWLWAFCEIILVHTDRKGVLMT